MNRDPIGEKGGVNLYGFVANNPVSLVDRNGLDFATWSGAGPAYGNWTGASLPSSKGPDAVALLWSWLTGNGKYDNINLGPEDGMTQNMSRSTVMELDREKLRNELIKYCKAGGKGSFSMRIGNELGGIPKWKYALWEFPTSVLTNTDAAFVGSFTTGMITARSIDCCNGKADIHVHAINYSGAASATHRPPTNGQYGPGQSLANDNPFGNDGPMHTIQQTFDWDESISFTSTPTR